jgi:hypothetical protein
MKVTTALLALTCALALSGTARAASPDQAGVRDAENRWSEAFMTGDAAALEDLLDADYVSVGSNGKPRPKAEIIHLATAYAKAHPGAHAKPMPSTSTIRVIGDAAVVQHHSPEANSVDVFYFRDGQWHAWYSQHTQVTQ